MLLLDYWYHGLHRYQVLEFTNTDHLVKERFEPKLLPSDVVAQLLFKSYLDICFVLIHSRANVSHVRNALAQNTKYYHLGIYSMEHT